MASSTAATRARSSRRTTAASPSSGGIVSVNVTSSGSGPSARKKCLGRFTVNVRPASSAPSPFTPGQ
jgi:hypothetical protein